VQASKYDFYFSHRIWFFFRSVIYNNLADKEQEDKQRAATDKLVKALWASIVENLGDSEETKVFVDQHKTSYVFGPEQAFASKMERLFLANSFDLIELLVRFHLAHLYPQLRGCKLVKELEGKQNLAHEKQIKSWQE
jgi:hypothetical protein